MSSSAHSLTSRLLTVFSASMGAWALLLSVPEVMQVEHRLQQGVRQMTHPQYSFQQGDGTHTHPYRFACWENVSEPKPPFIVGLGEDPEKIFDTNPPSASDCAVLLDTLQSLGIKQLVIGTPLVWENPDPFAVSALEIVMGQFPACITTAELQRVIQDQPIPAALQRASLPWEMVREPKQDLPVMNALAFADTQLGRDYTWAGFSSASGPPMDAEHALLVARWGDRVVFSSSFLAVLLHKKIHPKELIIEPGQGIFSPRTGDWWAMDRFGRYRIQKSVLAPIDLQATQLIRAEEEVKQSLSRHNSPLHLLATDNPSQATHDRQLLQSLRYERKMRDVTTWARLPIAVECAVIAICAAQALFMMNFTALIRLGAILLLATQWLIALFYGQTWLPLLPLCVALVLSLLLDPLRGKQRSTADAHS